MNKIISEFEKNCLSNSVLQNIYGISETEHFDCVFVAPSWTVDKVFDTDNLNIEQIFKSRDATTSRIRHDGKNYLFITLYIGAPVITEFCLSCYKMRCDNFIFLGAVGALVPDINVGDIIIPEYSISGTSATIYLHEKLNPSNLFEHIYSTKKLNQCIENICDKIKIKPLNVPVISIDSIVAEYAHFDEFRSMGAKAIEMETAAFFACMSLINKNASAILVVSDNSATGEHLVGRTEEDKKHYHTIRKSIQNILLKI